MPIRSLRSLFREPVALAALVASVALGQGCASTAGSRGTSSAAAPATAPAPVGAGANASAAAAAKEASVAAPAPTATKDPVAAGAAAAPARTFGVMRIPLFDAPFAATPVARVDDDAITVDEVVDVLAMSHQGISADKQGQAGKRDVTAILDRLIDMRLFVAEARDMKLDELPEVKDAIASFERLTRRETLKKEAVKGVTPDAAEVETHYQEATREWKVKTALFPFQEDAKEMKAQLKAGKEFDALAKAALDAKKAKAVTPAEFLPPARMLPQVLSAVQNLKPGGVSEPVKVPGGYALLAVEEIRHVDSPEIHDIAEKASVTNRSMSTLRRYYNSLVAKHAKIAKKLVDRIDFEAPKPGFMALMKDRRLLVTIKGEKPITVGDLASEINKGFFHGVESAVKEKRINAQKWDKLDEMLFRRLLDKEADLQRIAETPGYRKTLTQYVREQLFGAYLTKVVLPDVKVPDSEIQAYYDAHKDEFMFPRFFTLESIAFDSAQYAQAALDKLAAGTDLQWVKEHAQGASKETDLAYEFHARTLSSRAVPADLANLLSGTKRGDHRLFGAPDGKFYVIRVLEDTPAEAQPFKEAAGVIAKKLYGEKVNEAVKAASRKLREGHDVEVYITRIEG